MAVNKLIENRLKFYKERAEAIKTGKYKPIPFHYLPGLNNYVPGIIPGILYKITSHTGNSKTQFTKFAFVIQPIMYSIRHNINFKILFFAAEETKEEFVDSLIIYVARVKYKTSIDRNILSGNHPTFLSENVLKVIEMASKDVDVILRYITIVDDHCYTPEDTYKICRKFAEHHGTFSTDAKGREIYTKNDPSQIVLCIYDHISLLNGDYDEKQKRTMTKFEALAIWSTEICKKILTKRWGWAVLNVQQQNLDSSSQQFTTRGESIMNKVIPSVDGLGDNRIISRDDYVILGIFAPNKYDFEEFKGYKITGIGPDYFNDNFRSIHLLKNRFGKMGKPLALFYDGSYNYFKELPKPTDPKVKDFLKLINN